MYLLTCIVQILVILLLSKAFSRHFYLFWYLLTGSQVWAVRLFAFFFLPGTLIHELSHWFTAELLRVPTGRISLWPQIETGKGVRMGSVEIAKVDIFRQTLIGIAPLISGICLLTLFASLLPYPSYSTWLTSPYAVISLLAMFLISNTMFASGKDLETAFVPFSLILIGLGLSIWTKVSLPEKLLVVGEELSYKLLFALTLTLVIDVGFLCLVHILRILAEKLLHKKVIIVRN